MKGPGIRQMEKVSPVPDFPAKAFWYLHHYHTKEAPIERFPHWHKGAGEDRTQNVPQSALPQFTIYNFPQSP